jgi:hypothetical protein
MIRDALIHLFFPGNTERIISLSDYWQKACHVSNLEHDRKKT